MSNSKPLASPGHQKGKALCPDHTSAVPPEDDSFFDTPPDVIFLSPSPVTTSGQPDRSSGRSKHVIEMVEMLSQPHCKATTGGDLHSAVTVRSDSAARINVDAKAGGTPASVTGGKKRNEKPSIINKPAKRRSRPPILVSSSSTSDETTEAQPVEEVGKSVVPPKTIPVATSSQEGNGKPLFSTSDPVISKAGLSSSTVPPPSPMSSGLRAQAPTPNKQDDDTRSLPFSTQNLTDGDWLMKQPIPASLEELVRLFASRSQSLGKKNALNILASKTLASTAEVLGLGAGEE